MEQEQQQYGPPEVEDLGTLAELTQAQGITGEEDGGSKFQVHHSPPVSP